MTNQKKLIVLVITLSLILILSSSYALLRSTKVSENNYSISIGDLEVTFQDDQTGALNLSNMYPMSDEEGESQEKTLTFTVENTGTVGTYYDVYIEELSTNPEFKSVIRFISKKDEEEYKEPKTLSENKYIEITGYLEPKQTSTYKVKVWLMEEADNTYMGKEFKAKIVVKAYQNYASEIVKSKLVKYEEASKEDFQGGLVGVNEDGELYNETDSDQTIREYRYSGPSVNNYVTFNDETWRILGVFKDENNVEHVKIVKNEILSASEMPDTYTVDGTEYKIKPISSIATAYWNYDGINKDNNWVNGGLKYWLNSEGTTDGYLKRLSQNAQNMIAETKYFLGTLTFNNGMNDTTVEAYQYERAVSGCVENKGLSTNIDGSAVVGNSTCRVWANNAAVWPGKIAIMYPSDYGYASDSSNWSTKKLHDDYSTYIVTNWLYKAANHLSYEWFLSPTSWGNFWVVSWYGDGFVSTDGTDNGAFGIRPTLYLKSNIKITGGEGTEQQPYILEL